MARFADSSPTHPHKVVVVLEALDELDQIVLIVVVLQVGLQQKTNIYYSMMKGGVKFRLQIRLCIPD